MTTTADAASALLTADQFAALPDDGNRYELVEGRLLCMSPSSIRSDNVGAELLIVMGAYVKAQKLGKCGGSQGGFRLRRAPDTVRAPDVWFIRADRIPPTGLPDTFWPGAPDLVVEVFSPSDRADDVMKRIGDYLAAGVRLMWLIDPRTRAAVVFRPTSPPAFLTAEDTLDGEDVIPGFRVPLADILG